MDTPLLSEHHKRKLSNRKTLIQRSIEYKQVAKRSIMPGLIIKSYYRKMTRAEMLILLINIAEDEGYEIGVVGDKAAPKLRIKKGHRTFYRSHDKTIYIANHSHSMNAHALIHEFAHHVCNPIISKMRFDAVLKGKSKPSYHGRYFTIYMEYLIYEYQKYWMASPITEMIKS